MVRKIAVTSAFRWDRLQPAAERRLRATSGDRHLCPDLVIELKSSSDRLRKVDAKMREYLSNGAQLGWMIDPDERSVTIYRPNGELETRTGINTLAGEGPVAGLVLDLAEIRDPLSEL